MLGKDDAGALRGVEMLRRVRRLNNTYDSIFSSHMGDAPLSPHRWRVLFHIWMEEQRGRLSVYPTQISKAQHLSKNTISEHLRALEDEGLLARELDPDDRRHFKIRLTAGGRSLVQKCTPHQVQVVNRLLDGLSAGEIAQIEGALDLLQQTLLRNGVLDLDKDRPQPILTAQNPSGLPPTASEEKE